MAQRPNNKLKYCLSDTLRRLLRPTPTLQEQRQAGQPPSRGCTVHAQGVKSWGCGFIGMEFCLAPPTAVADIFGPSTKDCFADGAVFLTCHPTGCLALICTISADA